MWIAPYPCQVLDRDHMSALASLRSWALKNGMASVSQFSKKMLSSVHLKTLDGATSIEVQLVDTDFKHFLLTDCNVNNLKLVRNGHVAHLALKRPAQANAGTVDAACSEIVSALESCSMLNTSATPLLHVPCFRRDQTLRSVSLVLF